MDYLRDAPECTLYQWIAQNGATLCNVKTILPCSRARRNLLFFRFPVLCLNKQNLRVTQLIKGVASSFSLVREVTRTSRRDHWLTM